MEHSLFWLVRDMYQLDKHINYYHWEKIQERMIHNIQEFQNKKHSLVHKFYRINYLMLQL